MELSNLILLSDCQKYCKISNKFDPELFNQILQEVQELDLRPLLGNEFFVDILFSIDNANYTLLMEGCKYVFNKNNYLHLGLKIVIAKFCFARILKDPSATTEYGYVNPINDWSTPSPDKIILRNITEAESAAGSYWEQTKLYILRNINLFPLFKICQSQPVKQGIQIVAIGGNSASLKKQFGGGDVL